VQALLARVPVEGWTRLRAGDGAKGPRGYDGGWVSLADPVDPLAPLVAGAAASQRARGPDGVCEVCAAAHHAGGGRAGGWEPLDPREQR
jgi:hypothetical protein